MKATLLRVVGIAFIGKRKKYTYLTKKVNEYTSLIPSGAFFVLQNSLQG